MSNPLLADIGLPDFAAITPEHVIPAVRQCLQTALEKLDLFEQQIEPTWDKVMAPIEEIERPFEYSWKPVGHLFGVKNSAELRAAYETIQPEIIRYSLRVRQSEPLYRNLKAIKEGPQWAKLDNAQRRIIDDRIKDAELAGIALSPEDRKRFNEIEEQLSKLGTDFQNHVLDATKAFGIDLQTSADVAGLPQSLKLLAAKAYNAAHQPATAATADTGPWRITLEFPLYGPFMEHSKRRDLREQVYRAFITRASAEPHNNEVLIPQILKLRHEKAKLLGYEHYAAVSLARKMAPSVGAIEEMFRQLREASWPAAERDLNDIQALKLAAGDQTPLELWDVAYWAERLREQRYAYTDEEVRPYFSFPRVLDGLFQLLNRLFGIHLVEATHEVKTWHPDVQFFWVHNEQNERIAGFFLDPYSRPEDKRGGAWMDDCLGRRRINGQLQLPIAHLVCNQTPPVEGRPSLMTFREVETLFHEFGHGLQHMLTTVDYPDASGINGVEWDAVELPSQFMENWCYHRPVLMGMTAHYQTGEPLPEELFKKIVAARNYRSGSMTLRQLLLGMTDLQLHSTFDPDGLITPSQLQQQLSKSTSILPMLPEDRSLCSFQHIFAGGYAAGYYSYKWAEILSADAFAAFEEAGLDDEQKTRNIGRHFRGTVLSLGGSQHPLEVYRAFRGRDATVAALLRHQGLVR